SKGVDAGEWKDPQTTYEGPHNHTGHRNQAAACSRSTFTHETTVCSDADDGQGENSGRQVGHSELASGGVLQSHRDAEHDDEAIAVACWHRICGERGQSYRDTQEKRLNCGGDAEQMPPVLAKARPKEAPAEGAENKGA